MTIAKDAASLPYGHPLPHDPFMNTSIQFVQRSRTLKQYTIELRRDVVADWHGGTEQQADDFLRALEILPSQLAELGVDALPPIGQYTFVMLPEGGGVDLQLMSDAKCRGIFTGIESFDENMIAAHGKRQNLKKRDTLRERIEFAERLGIMVIYGYIFDP